MIYLDTGCLLKLYYPEPESARVAALVSGQTIAFTGLHELEFTNTVQLKRFRGEATAAQVRATLSLIDQDLGAGVLIRVPLDWNDALRTSKAISKAHTHHAGSRSLDILHCAVASHLEISAFVTTDALQLRIALELGLPCPAV